MEYDERIKKSEVNPKPVSYSKLVSSRVIRLGLMFIMTIAIIFAIFVLIIILGINALMN